MNDYEVLGVSPQATPAEIKAAYRKLAMEHHPDKNKGSVESENKFKEITRAYENLKDGPKQQNNPFNGADFNPFRDFGFNFNFQQGGFRQTNPDYNCIAQITLESAFTGCDISVDLPMEQQSLKVDIPAGVEDGQRVVIEGRGSKQHADLTPGNLYVIVRIVPSPRFQRTGANLVTSVQVDLWDMLCGTTAQVIGIDGKNVTVKIPPNSNPESSIRVTGEGMSRMNDKSRGDLLVSVRVNWPGALSEEQLATVEALRNNH